MTNKNQENSALEILLVEDNEDHAELSLLALKASVKNRVVLVADGQEALDYLRHQGRFEGAAAPPRPGLILLDLRLPKVDGLEVLAQIKADEGLRSIPVCMLTTSADSADVDKAYALGANSYVTKPVSFKDFMAKVEKIGKFWLETNLLPTWLRHKEGRG